MAQIARVTRTDGQTYLFTDTNVIANDVVLVRFSDVRRCHWITDSSEPGEAARLKKDKHDCLIIELSSGRKVELTHLGQAVFPLLRFFVSLSLPPS